MPAMTANRHADTCNSRVFRERKDNKAQDFCWQLDSTQVTTATRSAVEEYPSGLPSEAEALRPWHCLLQKIKAVGAFTASNLSSHLPSPTPQRVFYGQTGFNADASSREAWT